MSTPQTLTLNTGLDAARLVRPIPWTALDRLLEKNWLPDWLIRIGIRRLLRERLREEAQGDPSRQHAFLMDLITDLKQSPIAIETRAANQQHYEVPTRFYRLCLGQRLKYSSGLWTNQVATLDAAEIAMLELTCQRAELANCQNILELGCGWGSLSLWMAEHYPAARITGVSNSSSHK
jgi:cyclopropane-fatty-acyl-phospholipid synthase